MKSVAIITLITFLSVQGVYADCPTDLKSPPSCSTLGYKNTITCPEDYVVCPFNKAWIWCKQYTCADGRYSTTDEGSCIVVNYHGKKCYNCDCADYALSACPTGGICEECATEGTQRYKLQGCTAGYTMSADGSECL